MDWEDFFRSKRKEITQAIANTNYFLKIKISEIIERDFDYACTFIDHPSDQIKEAEHALKDAFSDVQGENLQKTPNLVLGLDTEEREIKISDFGSDHAERIIQFHAIVKTINSIEPVMVKTVQECQACGHIMSVDHTEDETNEYLTIPTCTNPACGKKGPWKIKEKITKDIQVIDVQEPPESLREGMINPTSIHLNCKKPFINYVRLGERIRVTGILELLPVFANGKQKKIFRTRIRVLNIERNMKDESEIITEQDEKNIIELSNESNILQKLANSIAPHIKGQENIKTGILCMAVGGNDIHRDDGTFLRGSINMALFGDPGVAKSQLGKWVSKNIPHSHYTDADRVTEVGLTVAMKRNERTGDWSIGAGAAVMASGGILVLDEAGDLKPEIQKTLKESMEHKEISVSKADISVTVPADTSYFLIGNPKGERFDMLGNEDIIDQIPLTRTILSRCDLMYALRDNVNEEKDIELAEAIVDMRNNKLQHVERIPIPLLRKYISYAKTITPTHPPKIRKAIARFYADNRKKSTQTHALTTRQVDTICRICEAIAKIYLKETITEEIFNTAIKIFIDSYSQIAIDPETGKFDVDRIETKEHCKSDNDRMTALKNVILNLTQNGETAKEEDIIKNMQVNHAVTESWTKTRIDKLYRDGTLYKPDSIGYKFLEVS